MSLVDKIFKNTSKKTKKLALYTFLEVIAVLIMCFVGGCFDWMHLKFTFDRFKTWEFYETVLQKWVLYSCALLVGTFFKLEKEELNNKIYFSTLELYRMYLKYKLDSFIDFIENVFNPNTKKLYIKRSVENKLLLLDKVAKDSWKIEYNSAIKSGNFDIWSWSNKYSKKYAMRRMKLYTMKSKEYIEANWKETHIKYPVVNPHLFTPYLRKNISPDMEYRVQNETAKDMGSKVGRKLVLVFLISVMFAMFLMQPSANELLEEAYGWIVMIIQYIIRVFFITLNFFIGLFTAKDVFYDNFILPIENRIRILKEYMCWEISYANNHDEIFKLIKKEFEAEEKLKQEKEEMEESLIKKEEHKEEELELTYEQAKKAGLIKDEIGEENKN